MSCKKELGLKLIHGPGRKIGLGIAKTTWFLVALYKSWHVQLEIELENCIPYNYYNRLIKELDAFFIKYKCWFTVSFATLLY